jgi:hypothetical protein
VLQVILSTLHPGAVVQVYKLSEDLMLDTNEGVHSTDILLKIKQLLEVFADVFAAKVTFPPPRACSHSIPLIAGATPISVRPYRYAMS